MSTAIFKFDHGQKKLHNAIGVKEEYLDDLSSKMRDVVVELKCDGDTHTVNDVSPSQIVERVLHELSYSQLVLISSFYIRDKIEELENLSSDVVESHILSSNEVPDDIKDIILNLKGQNLTSMDDIPEGMREKLSDFLKKLRNRK